MIKNVVMIVLLNDTYIVVIRVFKLDEMEFECLNWFQAKATSDYLIQFSIVFDTHLN